MNIYYKISDIRSHLIQQRQKSVKSGFVPTMGALHNGHLSLIDRSKSENDLTISSIFVNSTQFNDQKDFKNYPRTLDQDIKLLEKQGCDILFVPDENEMYPEKSFIHFSFDELDSVMEGKYRPGHFNGVALVVLKLLNIIQPVNVYFGQKDLQQYTIIYRMIQDLNLPVNCFSCPTIRDADGLALSSRNLLLTRMQRKQAPLLYEALLSAGKMLNNNEKTEEIKKRIASLFNSVNGIDLEYFEIVDTKNLKPVQDGVSYGNVAICIAARLGNTRLIDNIIVKG